MTTNSAKIYVLIPAYNEERGIENVIKDLRNDHYTNILVVNDGSYDNTEKIAYQAGAEVLNHIINRGQGAALRTGIEYIRETYNPDVIITFDADGQHRVSDIQKLIEPILNNKADISLGSRFLSADSNVPLFRKLILKAGIIFTNFVSNIHLTDTHNGLRALGKKAFDMIEISHRGMEHASDIIDEVSRNKLRYAEVPVTVIYSEYSKEKGTNRNSHFIKMGIKIIIKKLTK